MVENILVTGSDGFIGSRLCKTIDTQYSLVRHVRKIKQSDEAKTNLFELEINSINDWSFYLTNIQSIIHLASIAHKKNISPNDVDVTRIGTIRLAQQAAAIGVRRFIFISSINVIGSNTYNSIPFNENSTEEPNSKLAYSKLLIEKELKLIAENTSMEVVIIRPALVYGEHAPGNIKKLTQLISRFPILPFALCQNQRSFISVDNLVDFISACIEHPKAANEVFCISDGIDVSIREFTNGIASGLNKRLIQLPVPMFIFKLIGKLTGKSELIEQLIGDLQVDSSKASRLLGWKPSVTMGVTFLKLKPIK